MIPEKAVQLIQENGNFSSNEETHSFLEGGMESERKNMEMEDELYRLALTLVRVSSAQFEPVAMTCLLVMFTQGDSDSGYVSVKL